MPLTRNALLWASRNRWLAHHFPRYRFAKAAVKRFMPGTDVDAAIEAAQQLEPLKVGSIFTRLGENLTDMGAATAVVEHYVDVLDRIARSGVNARISVKLTQLGLDISEDGATRNLITLAEHAAKSNNMVWVDMEDSSYVDRTLAAFRAALAQHRNVGLCLQSYLRRTRADLDALLDQTAAIRMVKGAYNEPADVAFPVKRDVDENFFALACDMIRAAARWPDSPAPAIGTHDIGLIDRLAQFASSNDVPRSAWEINMLYGIRTADQLRLAAAGHGVRVLVSYGEEWFPWYVRRLAERPANVWFVVRSMFSR